MSKISDHSTPASDASNSEHQGSPEAALNEALSACMDGQGQRHEHRFVVKRLCDDQAMTKRWGRYHVASAIMRQQSVAWPDLSERVQQAIEPLPSFERRVSYQRLLKPVAGGMIAASVALLALVGINQVPVGEAPVGNSSELGFVSQTTAMDRMFTQPATPVSFGNNPSSADRQRLERLLLQHQQAARGAGVGNYWPVVTLTPNQTPREQQAQGTDPSRDQ